MRSARRSHRFTRFDFDGLRLLRDFGKFVPPDELHLELNRYPKRHAEAIWDGKIFVDADLPE